MFSQVEAAPPVKVFELTADYNKCTGPNKQNLGVGAYRTNDGKPYVFKVVRECERRIAEDFTLNHEYLPIDGLPSFTEPSAAIAFGKEHPVIVEKRFVAVQSLGGTGALRLCAEFLHHCMKKTTVFVSKPTWPNHVGVFKMAGFTEVKEYRYWDNHTKAVNVEGMLEDLENAPKECVVILHAVAHNPTGMDLSREQWEKVLDVVQKRNLVVVMDCAYQGFGTGDLDQDAFSIRMLADRGAEFFTAQSMSKNFGLYNERVGNLVVTINSPEKVDAVRTQLKNLSRQMWSNPPSHGARIIATCLNDKTLEQQWRSELVEMAGRVKQMRQLLYEKLKVHEITWPHVINQTGMFSFTGLSPEQVKFLRNEYDIFLMDDGRVNMCAFTTENTQYIADAIAHAVQQG